MSVTLSPPIRIFAFVGVLVAVGLAAFFFLIGRSAGDEATLTPAAPAAPVTTPAKVAKPAAAPTRAPQARRTRTTATQRALQASGLPLPVRRSLRRNKVVVLVVYTPGAAVDSVVRAEAKAGAKAARAGLVNVSALSERLVQPIVAKTGVLPNPAVLVLRRPGRVIATLGVTDRETIALAVAHARR